MVVQMLLERWRTSLATLTAFCTLSSAASIITLIQKMGLSKIGLPEALFETQQWFATLGLFLQSRCYYPIRIEFKSLFRGTNLIIRAELSQLHLVVLLKFLKLQQSLLAYFLDLQLQLFRCNSVQSLVDLRHSTRCRLVLRIDLGRGRERGGRLCSSHILQGW